MILSEKRMLKCMWPQKLLNQQYFGWVVLYPTTRNFHQCCEVYWYNFVGFWTYGMYMDITANWLCLIFVLNGVYICWKGIPYIEETFYPLKNLSLLHSSSKSSFMSMCCMISVACPDCWSPDLEKVISCLPQWEYMAVARKLSEWTQADRTRQSSVLESVVANFPSDLRSTSLAFTSPGFCRQCADPKGLIFIHACITQMAKKSLRMWY